ncbi:MAG TPA: FlgO family outer membrane protein [Longimicrobiales bacterium]|nr:FlgO family outer membrane protein [Longimicrobiales bacterium]
MRLQPKRLAILAYMAVEATRRPCRRDTLLTLFWPESDERHARNALSQALHGLRGSLGAATVRGVGAEELQVDGDEIWCDAVALEQALGDGRFQEVVDLYRGPLVDGLHVRGAAGFEEWVGRSRDRLYRHVVEAVEVLIERSERRGNVPATVAGLRRLAELSSGDEGVVRRLMRTLDRAGDRAGALRVYERLVRDLHAEAGIEPQPESVDLAARVKAGRERASLRPPTVAVLPFADLGPDGELDYFGHGLAEETIATLARTSRVRVVARTTVFAAGVADRDIRSLGAWLDVDAIVEGSVRRSGSDLRVTARLVSTSNGHALWSATYDRPWGDAVGLQEEIAEAVASRLEDRLATSRPESGPRKARAHDLYLRGLYHRRKRTRPTLAEACSCFEQCVAEHPEHAAGHAALAFTYALAGWWLFDVFPPREAYAIAQAAADRALALDDRLAEAHLAVAITRQAFEWDGPGAEAAFSRALALDPENQDALGNYAGHLALRGRFDEALAVTREAEALDPGWIMPPTALGLWMLAARRYEEAGAHLSRAVELEDRFFIPFTFLGDCHRFSGRPAASVELYRRAISLAGPEPLLLGRLACGLAEQGNVDAARDVLAELESLRVTRFVLPSILGRVRLSLGDRDAAFAAFEQAVGVRDTTMALLPVWPGFDRARSDPRYGPLLARVRLWPKVDG